MKEEMNELVALGTNDAFSRYFMGQWVPERGEPWVSSKNAVVGRGTENYSEWGSPGVLSLSVDIE